MKAEKTVSAALVFCLILCLGISAFAVDEPVPVQYTDDTSVTVTKVYKLVGDGSSPAETFTLRQIGEGVVKDGEADSAPDLVGITDVSFAEGAATAEGAEAEFTITLPTYERVGIYEYTLAETKGTTAGVTYYGNEIRLVVTVINDEETGRLRIAAVHTESVGDEKSDRFSNIYSAGKLNITKSVTGSLGDTGKYFSFTVTLTGESDKTYNESYAVSGGSSDKNPTSIKIGEATAFYLKSDDTLSISNLPYGVSYTVTEDTPSDYTLTKSGDTGTVDSALQTAEFTNNKGGDPDTGVSLDSLPFIIVLVLAGIGAIILSLRKRFSK